jgi:hypothetical protein
MNQTTVGIALRIPIKQSKFVKNRVGYCGKNQTYPENEIDESQNINC